MKFSKKYINLGIDKRKVIVYIAHMTRENVEVENKEIIRLLVKKLSKQSGIHVKKINTLLIYSGAKKALKDMEILTNAHTELLKETAKL